MSTSPPTIGMAAVIASILIPLAQVVAPVVQEIVTTDQKVEVERSIAHDKHKEQVADILLKSYIDQDAKDQKSALAIIGALFPEYAEKLGETFGRYAKDTTVAKQAELVVAIAQHVPLSNLEQAREAERAGFEALADGDPAAAKGHFKTAYAVYPTFHNVHEIAAKLDTLDVANDSAVARTISSIRKENSWRMPVKIKARLELTPPLK